MLDFSLEIYKVLLISIQRAKYKITTVENFFANNFSNIEKVVILRHDVDARPQNSLIKAQIESSLNISSTYYFRQTNSKTDDEIIEKIADLKHEIGYHYEDLAFEKGDFEKAIQRFEKNLNYFRGFYPVKTICMHGSPLSHWDNLNMWQKYDYHKYDIIAEPYLDIDYNKFFYLTDTGRKWNDYKSSIRDKVNSKFSIIIKNTNHLVRYFSGNQLPSHILITTHPQRWHDNYILWGLELISQNTKNIVKKALRVVSLKS